MCEKQVPSSPTTPIDQRRMTEQRKVNKSHPAVPVRFTRMGEVGQQRGTEPRKSRSEMEPSLSKTLPSRKGDRESIAGETKSNHTLVLAPWGNKREEGRFIKTDCCPCAPFRSGAFPLNNPVPFGAQGSHGQTDAHLTRCLVGNRRQASWDACKREAPPTGTRGTNGDSRWGLGR